MQGQPSEGAGNKSRAVYLQLAFSSTACAMCGAMPHSFKNALKCCRPRCEVRQPMTHADQLYMAAAGLKGDHENFVWCALDASQFSEVLGATG